MCCYDNMLTRSIIGTCDWGQGMQKSTMWVQITPSYILMNIFSSKEYLLSVNFKRHYIKFCISGKKFVLLVQTNYKLW